MSGQWLIQPTALLSPYPACRNPLVGFVQAVVLGLEDGFLPLSARLDKVWCKILKTDFNRLWCTHDVEETNELHEDGSTRRRLVGPETFVRLHEVAEGAGREVGHAVQHAVALHIQHSP